MDDMHAVDSLKGQREEGRGVKVEEACCKCPFAKDARRKLDAEVCEVAVLTSAYALFAKVCRVREGSRMCCGAQTKAL